jgi:ATP-dependent exoDNAse (exonuclease V) alpha subunit
MEGMPVIARINQKSLGIVNNEMYKVKRIKADTVVFANEMKDVEVKISSINRTFNLAFCLTVHKSQGQTFNEPYTIYEWGKMDSTLRYVSLSRATEKEYINIV